MAARPGECATGRISSAKAACSRRGLRTRCWPIRTCVASTWGTPSACRCTPLPTVARGAPQGKMKPRLQTSLGQQLVLTPQLRQALHLLQLSALELESEINDEIGRAHA